jgi:hypothetical protein
LIGGRLAALMGVGEHFASFDIFYRWSGLIGFLGLGAGRLAI